MILGFGIQILSLLQSKYLHASFFFPLFCPLHCFLKALQSFDISGMSWVPLLEHQDTTRLYKLPLQLGFCRFLSSFYESLPQSGILVDSYYRLSILWQLNQCSLEIMHLLWHCKSQQFSLQMLTAKMSVNGFKLQGECMSSHPEIGLLLPKSHSFVINFSEILNCFTWYFLHFAACRNWSLCL